MRTSSKTPSTPTAPGRKRTSGSPPQTVTHADDGGRHGATTGQTVPQRIRFRVPRRTLDQTVEGDRVSRNTRRTATRTSRAAPQRFSRENLPTPLYWYLRRPRFPRGPLLARTPGRRGPRWPPALRNATTSSGPPLTAYDTPPAGWHLRGRRRLAPGVWRTSLRPTRRPYRPAGAGYGHTPSRIPTSWRPAPGAGHPVHTNL